MNTIKDKKKPKQKQINYVNHVIVPYNEITREIFFRQETREKVIIVHNGKTAIVNDLTTELQEYLVKNGCSVSSNKRSVDIARQKVFDINVRIRKSYGKDRKVNGIEITIPSTTYPEYKEKQIVFEDGLKALAPNIKANFSLADKYVRC